MRERVSQAGTKKLLRVEQGSKFKSDIWVFIFWFEMLNWQNQRNLVLDTQSLF